VLSEDEAMYAKLFARDALIVAAAALLWTLAAGFSAGPGAASDFSGLVVGVALGICALPLHEWGHFAGAILTRSAIEPATSLRSIFAFSFDSKRNSRRSFVAMSLGGWVGTAAAVWVAYGLLPDHLLASRVARGMVCLSVLLVVVTEIPLLASALWTGRIPPVEIRRPREDAERAAA
jgi:hypothetical protein